MDDQAQTIELVRSRALSALKHQDFDMFERLVANDQSGTAELMETLRLYQAELIAQAEELKGAKARAEAGMQRFRQLFLTQPLVCLVIDQEGRIADANAMADKIFGIRLHDGLPQRALQLMANSESKLRLQAAMGKVLLDGNASVLHLQAKSVDAMVRVCDVHLVRLEPDSTADTVRILASFVDQSTHVKSQQDLQKALESVRIHQKENLQLAMVARLTRSLVLIADSKWQIQWVNQAFEESTGYLFSTAVGHSPHALLLGPDTDQEVVRRITAQLEGGHAIDRQELQIYRQDGTPMWADLSISPVQSLSGRVSRYICVMNDISERRQAEQAKRENEENLRAIFEASPNGIAVLDEDGRIREMNSAGRCLIYPSSEQVLCTGTLLAEQVSLNHRGELQSLLDRALQRAELISGELVFAPDSGLEFLAEVACVPLRRYGQIAGMVVSIKDVTQDRQVDALRKENEITMAASRAQNDFLARVSHELRTPMNAILGFAQLMEIEALTAPKERQLERTKQILSAGWHLLNLINDVLNLTNVESDRFGLNIDSVPLANIVKSCLTMTQIQSGPVGVSLRLMDFDESIHVEADPVRLKQVLSNLLSNAVKYNQRDGWVELRVLEEADAIWVEVADSGVGMTGHQLAHLFEPFNRLGAEASTVQGTGIGLVITRKLVESMQGCIQVSSEAGRGTVFRVRLVRSKSLITEPANLVCLA